jgi:hypothetical protein
LPDLVFFVKTFRRKSNWAKDSYPASLDKTTNWAEEKEKAVDK